MKDEGSGMRDEGGTRNLKPETYLVAEITENTEKKRNRQGNPELGTRNPN